jgi:hypothetical protein
MPISNIRFENGIFYCKETGRVEESDARLWAEKACEFASQSQRPIVALVDATEAKYITAAARKIFARSTTIPGLHVGVVATGNFLVQQNAHLITLMSPDRHTHVFASLAEAEQFARDKAQSLRDDSARA